MSFNNIYVPRVSSESLYLFWNKRYLSSLILDLTLVAPTAPWMTLDPGPDFIVLSSSYFVYAQRTIQIKYFRLTYKHPNKTIMISQSLKSIPSNHCCFVYGTLMSQHVQQTLLGRVPNKKSKAFLPKNYSRHPVKGQVYPGVIRTDQSVPIRSNLNLAELEDHSVNGMILMDLDDNDMKILDWFEDVEYERVIVPIYSIEGEDDKINLIDANVYVWVAGESQLDLTESWNYEQFISTKLDWYLQHTVIPCRREIERFGLVDPL